MKYINKEIVLQEVPDEISLAFSISGCPLRCPWCHSPECQDWNNWEELTNEILIREIENNKWISCVLFYWWEWDKDRLLELIRIIKNHKLKVALYSWYENMISELASELDYYKIWPYIEKLWGLNKRTTNQRIWKKVPYNGIWLDISTKFWI